MYTPYRLVSGYSTYQSHEDCLDIDVLIGPTVHWHQSVILIIVYYHQGVPSIGRIG